MILKFRLSFYVFFLFLGNIYCQNLEGTVINSSTSEPVENVKILNLSNRFFIFTDSDGKFSIPKESYPVNLQISAVGFVQKRVQIGSSEDNLILYINPSFEELSEITLKSTLIPNELQKIPAAVSVISSEDINRIDATNLVQVFNNVPGVYVSQGALNTNKMNIRGIGARSQYSTNRIQAYFNGIPLSTAEGELTLDDIDPESIAKIEIIKGPVSSIYGAGLGGAINLYAAEAEPGETKAAANVLFGSFGMLKKTVLASYGTETTSIYANYNDLESDGYRDNGNYSRKSGLVSAKFQTTKTNSFSLLANFTKLKAFIPSSLNEDDFRNDPSGAAFTWKASQGFESYDRGMMGASYEHYFSNDFKNITSVYLNFRDAFEPRPFDILKEEKVAAGARTRFNLSASVFDLPSEISFGGEYYNEWYEIGTFKNLYRDFEDQGSVLGEQISNNEQNRNYSNFFGQVNLELTSKWVLEGGLNLNNTRYSLTDLFVQDNVDQTGNYEFKTVLSPRLGTSFEISTGKNIYASISHGFSTPGVAETLTPEGLINTELLPETGYNYELGFKGNWFNKALYTEVALYSIQIKNLLVAQRIAEDQYVGINAGKTNHNGIEFFTAYRKRIATGILLKPYLNASLNYFKFEEFIDRGTNYAGNNLPGVPENTINLGLDLELWNNFNFYSNYFIVGKIPLNDANSQFTNKYSLLNLKAVYRMPLLSRLNLNVTAGINNLTNKLYAASVVPNAVGFGGASPRYYYPGNPRNYFGGVGLKYIF